MGSSGVNPVLFLFLDGVGLGAADPATNPFAAAHTPFLEALLGGRVTRDLAERRGPASFSRLDATLGYGGLPQSATGQATLLTGHNGAEAMNGHYGPWPGPTLKALLDRGTLFHEVVAAGGSAGLVNAYPDGYFQALDRGRLKVNVPVYAARAAGLALADLAAYRQGEALAADLTGAYLASLDPALKRLEPEAAGRRLARLAAAFDLCFFDLWLTDRVGHRGSFEEAVALVATLDRFLAGLVPALGEVTLVVTSDHGNLEDKSVHTHTTAPVPLLALGPKAEAFAGLDRLEQVAPAVREALRGRAG